MAPGGRITVRDFGRGIPLGKIVDCVSKINTGAKYNDDVFQFSVGLNGVGTKAVNALSKYFLARSHRDGQFAEAEFKQAIAKSPNAPQLHYALGYLYWRWKRYEDAIGPLQEELRINPRCASCYFYLGNIALKKRQAEQGLNNFKEALRVSPAYSDAYLGIGRAYVMLGQPEEAITFFRQGLKLQPGQVEAHYWLGKALIQVGQAEEGQRELALFEQSKTAETQHIEELFDRTAKEKTSHMSPDPGVDKK